MATFTYRVQVTDSRGKMLVQQGVTEAEDVESGPAAGPAILAASRLALTHALKHVHRLSILDDRQCKGPFTIQQISLTRMR